MLGRQIRSRFPVVMGFLIVVVCCGVNCPFVAGGVYYDLGQPVIGGWQRHAWVVWDPVLKRDLLWSQEGSQNGAVLYALDIDSGDLIEAHDIPAREVSGIHTTPEGVLYLSTISGLAPLGNELLRFDPKRRKIERLGLASTPRNRCFGSVIGRDGCVYIGTHDQGRLFRFDPRTDIWSDLGQMVPPPILPKQNIFLLNLHLTSTGKILAAVLRTAPSQVVEIDPEDGSFHVIDSIHSRNFVIYGDRVLSPSRAGLNVYNSRYQLESHLTVGTLEGGAAYPRHTGLELLSANEQAGVLARAGNDLVRIDLDQKRLFKIIEFPFRGKTSHTVDFLTTTDGQRAVVIDHPQGRFAVINLKSGAVQTHKIGYTGRRGTQICGLGKASDGSIYGTNIIGMHIFRHDPLTGQTRDLGHVGWLGSEVYNVINVGEKIFFGTYGGGQWGVYDPKKPWNPDFKTFGTSQNANPRKLGSLGNDNDPEASNRPFEYAVGPQGRIWIASRAYYGHPGGSLIEFDPQTGSRRVFRDLKRSVQTVTADDRYIFAGTNMRGGRGSGDRANAGTLFVFDPQTGRRVFEEVVVPGAKAVVCIRYNQHDKRVYATTDNQKLLAFHPRTFRVLQIWDIRSVGTPLAGVPEDVGMIHITAAHNGDVYGVTYRDLFRLNREQGRIEYMETPPLPGLYQIVEGQPGVFYMGAGTHLLKYVVETPTFYR